MHWASYFLQAAFNNTAIDLGTTIFESKPLLMQPKMKRICGNVFAVLLVAGLGIVDILKIIPSGTAIKASLELGFTHATIAFLSIINLVILGLFLFPRTQVIAAVMLTGYFGGAAAVLLRDSQPILPPTFIILATWIVVVLRDINVLRVGLGMKPISKKAQSEPTESKD